MARNILESGTAQDVIFTAEAVCMIFSASVGLRLAALVAADIGRGDVPNATLEAVGTIIGAALTIFSARSVIQSVRDATPEISWPKK
jgi:hypothetical protein